MLLHTSVYAQVIQGLDMTFANSGVFIGTDTSAYIKIGLQTNNKLVVGANQLINWKIKSVVRCFNEDGTIDYGFGNNGTFIVSLSGGLWESVGSMILQSDGKILLGGGATDDLLLIRLKPNGELDSSFGNNGIRITGFSGDEYITSLAVQADGKIVSAGIRQTPEDAIQIVRYHTDGSLDSSFGSNGEVYYSWTWGYFHYPTANDVAVLPDGRIVVGATTKIDANGKYCFTVLRLLSDGSPDTSFNHTGLAYADVGSLLAYCKAMRVQPDGKILLSGYSDSITLVRFDTTGILDAGFGNGGKMKLPKSTGGTALTLQPDGKILVNGDADINFIVYRLNADGSRDMGFGLNGSINQQVLNKKNSANDIAVQADGKIIVSGSASDSTSNYTKPFLLRYLPNAASVEELPENKRHFKIYPNPVKDRLIVSYMNNKEVIANISVYDIAGKKIASKIKQFYKNSFVTIDVSDLTTGIYFIYIANDKGLNERFKFVKQ